MNDLSNNIDLPSTLTRAERLFLRFQRTVEAIDRKTHFPAPSTSASLRARKPQAELPHPPSTSQDDDDSNGKNKANKSVPYTQHQQPQTKPGGLVGAIAAIGATQRPTSGAGASGQPGPASQQARKGTGAGIGAGSGSDARAHAEAKAEAEAQRQQQRIITPELRDLLSRKIYKLEKQTVKVHGGGVK